MLTALSTRLLPIAGLIGALSGCAHAATSDLPTAAAANATDASSAVSSPLDAQDFAVTVNQQNVALMEHWNDDLAGQLGSSDSSDYVGESPADSGSYKYYRHQFGDFTLFISNLDWDKQQRDINAYRVAQITLHSPALTTARGIHIGSSEQALLTAYGDGAHQRYLDVQRRCYYYHGMELVFTLQQQNVSGITLVWSGR